MNKNGLTLTELLIVLLIIGMGWFTLLPRLDLTQETNDPLHQINTLLESAARTAQKTHSRQGIILFPGRDFFEWNDRKAQLPDVLSRAEINGKPMSGTRELFFIYPTGHMDELFFVLSNGSKFRSRPLLGRIETNS